MSNKNLCMPWKLCRISVSRIIVNLIVFCFFFGGEIQSETKGKRPRGVEYLSGPYEGKEPIRISPVLDALNVSIISICVFWYAKFIALLTSWCKSFLHYKNTECQNLLEQWFSEFSYKLKRKITWIIPYIIFSLQSWIWLVSIFELFMQTHSSIVMRINWRSHASFNLYKISFGIIFSDLCVNREKTWF